MVYIYGLIDPRNPEEFRYIGKSVNPNRRLYGHIAHSLQETPGKSHKCDWIKALDRDGLTPTMVILCSVLSTNEERHWEFYERYLIKFYRDIGHRLTNYTDGGEGGVWKKGYKQTPEHIEKNANRQRGVPKPEWLKEKWRPNHQNKKWFNKDGKEKWASKQEKIDALLSDGWVEGRVWKSTEESRKKNSLAKKEHNERHGVTTMSMEAKRKISESNKKAWNKRKENGPIVVSSETRQKLSIASKMRWDKERHKNEQDNNNSLPFVDNS